MDRIVRLLTDDGSREALAPVLQKDDIVILDNLSSHKVAGDLLTAELSEKQARSIKYQMTIARLPLAKEIDEFAFETTPVNETLVRDLAGGEFLEHQRNVVLIGGTGTGKSHLAVGIARACIRSGRRGRFFNAVDLVNKLESEVKLGQQGRIADSLVRVDLVILDELGYLLGQADAITAYEVRHP